MAGKDHKCGWVAESTRDIYYNDPVCFGSQRVVDMLVDDIAYTVGVDRAALNVVRLFTWLQRDKIDRKIGSSCERTRRRIFPVDKV